MLAPTPAMTSAAINIADALAQAGNAKADAGERGAERQHDGHAKPFCQPPGRNLQTGKRQREHGLHQPEHGIAEAELALPDRQHYVDEVGVAVVQRVRAAGNAHGAPLFADRDRADAASSGALTALPAAR